MLKEEEIIYIKGQIYSINSLAKILEYGFENNDEINSSDIFALILVIKENLTKLSEYMRKIEI